MELPPSFKLIKQGAEAKIYAGDMFGLKTLAKVRFKKEYRVLALDELLGKERLKAEALGLLRCRMAGVMAPAVYHVDIENRCIYLQHLEGETVKDKITSLLDSQNKENLMALCKDIGASIAKIHLSNLIHGDLTTSNLIINNKELYLIDFGLSSISSKAEDRAVDLYVLERAITSTHRDGDIIFGEIFESYIKNGGTNEVHSKYNEVKARGRKRTMIG